MWYERVYSGSLVMKIPEVCVQQLGAAGLLVSEPFPANRVRFPDGIVVGKPAGIGGNSVPGCSSLERWGLDDPAIDAPGLFLHEANGKWYVTLHEIIPGPGKGDFVDEWPTAEDAVADIIDFYFGDAARMEPARQRGIRRLARRQKSQDKAERR